MKNNVKSPQGNVFYIQGIVLQLLLAANREADIKRVMADMKSGDYRHALDVETRETFGILEFEGFDYEDHQ